MTTDEPRKNLGGRPATGRKVTLQAAFDPEDAEAIGQLAQQEGKGISATLRDLALTSLAVVKSKTPARTAPTKKRPHVDALLARKTKGKG